uniref:Phytocyanin domain-containing protein n=1 Tax=Leersia perrieri TaxID=77586 RepID=A0A0D9X665_9ORYZ
MAAAMATVLCAAALLFAAVADARDHVVGGNNGGGWKVPAQPDAFNKWAQITRFHVGDNLVFKFDGAADAVLEVTREDYDRCNTASPVGTYKPSGGGAATVPLTTSGLRYFVGAAAGSCDKGERVIVLVMSEKHSRRAGHDHTAAAPAPAESPLPAGIFQAPAPAPVTGLAGRTAASGGAVLLAAGILAVVGF